MEKEALSELRNSIAFSGAKLQKELEDTITANAEELDGRIAGQTRDLESETQDIKKMLTNVDQKLQDINKRLKELENEVE